jgi:hypothetical protein
MGKGWRPALLAGIAWLGVAMPAARAEMGFSTRQIAPVEGVRFSGVVASFTETGARRLVRGTTALIRWGDGESSRGSIARARDGSFAISGRHLYRRRGSYAVLVEIDRDGERLNTVQSSAVVADAGFRAQGLLVRRPPLAANPRFVNQLYLDLLDRPADAASLAALTRLLARGTSRTAVAHGILASTELQSRVVGIFYQEYLVRDVDPASLTTMLDMLGSGATFDQIQALILGSDEYFALAGSFNEGFLNALYQDILGREVDPAGLVSLTAALEGGTTRTQVATLVLGSEEARTRALQGLYQQFLHREAGPTRLAELVKALQGGTRWEEIIATILGSDEYFAGVSSRIAFSGKVGTLIDRNPFADAGDFVVTIDWGDGIRSEGNLVPSGRGRFAITGSHTYLSAATGPRAITITIDHGAGEPLVITSQLVLR